ncbi:MAG: B12-binding domain-containing radical SAM protein [Candidatus Helarchaeota archaeon]
MSDYKDNPFVAFSGGFPYRLPIWTSRRIFYPPLQNNEDHSSIFAPYGLRKIEAALINHGYAPRDIVTVQPDNLKYFIGPETKIVAISSMDPLGLGYVSFTYSTFIGWGEIPCNLYYFMKLIRSKELIKYNPKIIVGGAGAWQLGPNARKMLGIDHVVIGEADNIIGKVVDKILKGENVPEVINAKQSPSIEEIPKIYNPALHGVVEISRGCGRNCKFCTPTMRKKRNFPIDRILKEVDVNVKKGTGLITLATEDLFLYGCEMNGKFIPNGLRVYELLKKISERPGVTGIQPAHISLAPVVADPEMVSEVSHLLQDFCRFKYNNKPVITAETGIETGSARLIKKYMAGKCLPFKPEQWPEIVKQALDILEDNNWIVAGTLLVGMPDEQEEDTLKSLELVDELFKNKIFLIPLLFANLHECMLKNEKRAIFDVCTDTQLEFFLRCWEHNLKVWRKDWLSPDTNPKPVNLVMKSLTSFLFSFAYLTYYRWRNDSVFNLKKELMREVAGVQPIQAIRNGIRKLKGKIG